MVLMMYVMPHSITQLLLAHMVGCHQFTMHRPALAVGLDPVAIS